MTTRVGDLVLIAPEPPAACQLCGDVAELRPYGPEGQRICFRCAMKDPEGTSARAMKILFGDRPAENN